MKEIIRGQQKQVLGLTHDDGSKDESKKEKKQRDVWNSLLRISFLLLRRACSNRQTCSGTLSVQASLRESCSALGLICEEG